MASMTYKAPGGATIRVGYRTPGLSESHEPVAKMALAQELGMEVVEPQMIAREFPDDAAVEAYAKAANDAGIDVNTAGAFPSLTDPAAAGTVPDELEKCIRWSRILGNKYLFVCIQYPPEDVPQPDIWTLLTDNLKRACDQLGEAGMELALEPEWFIGSVERLERLHRLVDRPNLKINFDATNMYLYGSDPIDGLRRLGHLISSGHIKDGEVRGANHRETPVGKGEVDYAGIFREIIARKMSIDLHIEHCSKEEQVRAAAAHINPVIRDVIKKTAS